MISSFKSFLIEESKDIYITFGRMNPPTIGHEKLMNKLAEVSGKSPYRIYLSHSSDKKKNPLVYREKLKVARKMFPKHARSIIQSDAKTIMEVMTKLYDEGFRSVSVVVGSDRVNEFNALLKKYNGQESRHGMYNFNTIKIISAGERDPDAEGVEGMSASKMRAAASDNDFTTFSQGLPKSYSDKESKNLFNMIRRNMGLKEEKNFKNIEVQFKPVSYLREAYVRNDILNEGEEVVMTKKGIVGTITHRGPNYVVVESKGEKWRCWLDEVSSVDPNEDMSYNQADFGATPEEGPYRDLQEEKNLNEIAPAIGYAAMRAAPLVVPLIHRNVSGIGSGTSSATDTAMKIKKSISKALGRKTTPKKQAPTSNVPIRDEKTTSPQDPDIKDRPGTQPKAYHKGLKKKTKGRRDAHFKRQSKMSDDDPKAYKPAPGDAKSKTKPSRHTIRFKQMFGEQDAQALAKMRIDREKKADARKHDRMMDRARMMDMAKKNRETK